MFPFQLSNPFVGSPFSQFPLRISQIFSQPSATGTALLWYWYHSLGQPWAFTVGQSGGCLWAQAYREGQGRSAGFATEGEEGRLNPWKTLAVGTVMSGERSGTHFCIRLEKQNRGKRYTSTGFEMRACGSYSTGVWRACNLPLC